MFCINSWPNKVKCLWKNNSQILNSFSISFPLGDIGGIHFPFFPQHGLRPSQGLLSSLACPLQFCSTRSSYLTLSLQTTSLTLVFRVTLLTYISTYSKNLLICNSTFACSGIPCLPSIQKKKKSLIYHVLLSSQETCCKILPRKLAARGVPYYLISYYFWFSLRITFKSHK